MSAMGDVDILDAIDAATGCQFCGGSLGDSPSDDFCSPAHQRQWHDQNVEPLPWSEDAAVVYVGADHARVPLTEPAPTSARWMGARFTDESLRFYPRCAGGCGTTLVATASVPVLCSECGPREQASRERARHGRGHEFAWFVVDEAHTHTECNVEGCSNLARVAWTRADTVCSDHLVERHRANWRLPRQTGSFRADFAACERARDEATTEAQRAAVALRTEQLAERAMTPWRSMTGQLAEAFERVGHGLRHAVGGLLRADGHVAWTHHSSSTALDVNWPSGRSNHECEPSARERALQARRNRNTGPPAARMDGRRGRGVRR